MWCPKCKVEYRDGITVCADCGTPLVEGSEEDFDVVEVCWMNDEETVDKFIEYLSYSKLEGTKQKKDEEKGVYVVTVPTAQQKKAERLFEGFMLAMAEDKEKERLQKALEARQEQAQEDIADDATEELEEQEEEERPEDVSEAEEYDWDAEEQEEQRPNPFEDDGDITVGDTEEDDEMPEAILYEPSKEYVKKEDAYKDTLFSGWTFIIFGVAGLVYLALCKAGVIPVSYNLIVFVCITAMFAFFFIGGIVSIVKSGKIKSQIPVEEKKTKEIKEWLEENLTDEIISSWKDEKISEEENDLLVMAHIRASLIKQYPEEEASYLEMIYEEYYTENIQAEETSEEEI